MTAQLVAASTHARPGDRLNLAVRLEHEPGWHTYWRNPGDSGLSTRLTWTLPEGLKAGPILWPVPERIDAGPLTSYGHSGETFLLTDVEVPRDWSSRKPLSLSVKADWLVCKDVCLPGGARLQLELPVSAAPPQPDPVWGGRLQAARAALPGPAPGQASVAVTERHLVLSLDPAIATGKVLTGARFFPDAAGIVDHPSPQVLEQGSEGARLLLVASSSFTGGVAEFSGVLVLESSAQSPPRAFQLRLPYPGGAPRERASPAPAALDASQIRAAASAAGDLGTLAAMALAFLGGLVLNLMPCVFPVVSIKVLGFLDQAHGDRRQLRQHGLAFAGGILICFWGVAGALMALRAGGEALGWGYQLQSPPVVAGLALLFFVLGLNLSGFFELGASVQGAAAGVRERSGLAGAFLSGVLATAVATPCTAPFMGAALGYALTRPVFESMLVFSALAAGMALPYVMLSFFPRLLERLPRPGRWMESLRQFLAFPLYLTVVWLAWVLGEQAGMDAAARLAAALVGVALALWTWTRFRSDHPRLAAVGAALLLGVCVAAGWPGQAVTPAPNASKGAGIWTPWSEQALAQARARGPVLVDFTAAWCVTCQVNKRLVLETDTVGRALAAGGVQTLRADWTHRDAAITRALAGLGRSGVPVYALYPAGQGEPRLLPEILTTGVVLEAVSALQASGRP